MTVEGVLYALSDPVRARIFAQIANANCAKSCTAFAKNGGKELAKSTLSQHFKILREAGLIRSERVGVSMQNTSRCGEFKGKIATLIDSIMKAYAAQSAACRNSA